MYLKIARIMLQMLLMLILCFSLQHAQNTTNVASKTTQVRFSQFKQCKINYYIPISHTRNQEKIVECLKATYGKENTTEYNITQYLELDECLYVCCFKQQDKQLIQLGFKSCKQDKTNVCFYVVMSLLMSVIILIIICSYKIVAQQHRQQRRSQELFRQRIQLRKLQLRNFFQYRNLNVDDRSKGIKADGSEFDGTQFLVMSQDLMKYSHDQFKYFNGIKD